MILNLKRGLVVLVLLFTSPLIFSHPGSDDNPTDIITGTSVGRHYGGYGFVHEVSEAEANWAVNFRCSTNAQREYLANYCGNNFITPETNVETFITSSMRIGLMQKFREKAMEYYMLQLNAVASSRPIALERPSCIPEDSPTWQAISTSLATNPPQYGTNQALQNRAEAVQRTADPRNMARALSYAEFLKHQLESRNCSRSQDTVCANFRNTLLRVYQSFPVLWRSSHRSTSYSSGERETTLRNFESSNSFIDSNDRIVNTNYYDQFKNSIKSVLGAHADNVATGGSSSEFMQRAKTAGESYWNSGIATQNAPDYVNLDERIQNAWGDLASAPAGSDLALANSGMQSAVTDLYSNQERNMRTALRNLCSDMRLANSSESAINRDIGMLAIRYPQVLRQALIDMPDESRNLAQVLMCQSGMINNIRDEVGCDGVGGGPLPGDNPVEVRRRNYQYSWPYQSQNYYDIGWPGEGSPVTVSLDLNLVVSDAAMASSCGASPPDANSNGIPDCIESKSSLWKNDVQGYLNCATGTIASYQKLSLDGTTTTQTCPNPNDPAMQRRNPPVQFAININLTRDANAPMPKMNLHECYHMDVPDRDQRGNCTAVRQYHLDRCSDPPAQCQTDYDASFADPAQRYNLMRADSGNLFMGAHPGTVRHELLHLIGAPDEYPDSKRPFTPLADRESVMSCSKCNSSRLWSRHLDQILSPMKCGVGHL